MSIKYILAKYKSIEMLNMIFIYNVLRSKVAYFIFCFNQIYITINWKFNNQQYKKQAIQVQRIM